MLASVHNVSPESDFIFFLTTVELIKPGPVGPGKKYEITFWVEVSLSLMGLHFGGCACPRQLPTVTDSKKNGAKRGAGGGAHSGFLEIGF